MEAIPLDLEGKIYNKNIKIKPNLGGLFSVLRNHLLRGNCWKFLACKLNKERNELFLLDERGQIYLLNFENNIYSSLRLASSPIFSFDFLHSASDKSCVVLSYQNGLTIVINTITNQIISTIYSRGSDPICNICCHPNKSLVILLSLVFLLSGI